MTILFEKGELSSFLQSLIDEASAWLERRPEDEVLARSNEDLVAELRTRVAVEPLMIGEEPVDGSVMETTVDVSHNFGWYGDRARGFEIKATYEYSGDQRLFSYRPSQRLMIRVEAEIGASTLTIAATQPGLDMQAEQVKASLQPSIERIRRMASFASADATAHNAALDNVLSGLVEGRKDGVRKRRDLAGALGFPLQRRRDAPRPVPLERKSIGSARRGSQREPYKDEPALTAAQFEDALSVVRSTLIAMERTPSVASGKPEEELRDQILVQLNGTFTGAATGETFVQKGKTDILIKDGDRHVFVGECKWWTGPKACSAAIDQLLGYLPWRDEKASLILFIDRRDASAVIEKVGGVVRDHESFKRAGTASNDPAGRRNFVLGHPDDPDREIHLAILFAVLPKDR